jgi:tRNA A-37 threonylcarbamoyl transferase component Bud32
MARAEQVASRPGLNIHLSPGVGNREVLEAFLPSPEGFLRGGTVFKPGSRGFAVMAVIAGRACFVKHYRCLGWSYRLRNAFRTSRAVRTWAVSHRMLALGVPVPAPLFCVEERRSRLLGDAYLVTEFVAGSCDLLEYWGRVTAPAREAVLRRCAEVLGRMHSAGCCHGDLKWHNVLVRVIDESPEIVLVDVDAAHCRTRVKRRQAESDLRRFVSDLDRADPSGVCRGLFLSEWERWLKNA